MAQIAAWCDPYTAQKAVVVRAMSVHQLVYISAATRQLSQNELSDILKQARVKNAGLGVTGILVHDSGSFLQVLEGKLERVSGVFRSIEADARHRRVVVLARQDVERPSFAEWSMGFADRVDARLSDLPGFRDLTGPAFDPARLAAVKNHAFYVLEAFSVGRLRQFASF